MIYGKKEVKVGLIRGRHEMPVDNYLLDVVSDVFDFNSMYERFEEVIPKLVTIVQVPGQALNSATYTEDLIYRSEERLVVYVTGLTAVTAELISYCAGFGIYLTLMHYDMSTGDYVPQVIF